MEPITLSALALKLKSAAAGIHSAAQMAGLMLEDPPLCTNVQHSELTCIQSDLPVNAYCDACRAAAESVR